MELLDLSFASVSCFHFGESPHNWVITITYIFIYIIFYVLCILNTQPNQTVQQPKIEMALKFWIQTLILWYNFKYESRSYDNLRQGLARS